MFQVSSGENSVGAETCSLVKDLEEPLFVFVSVDSHRLSKMAKWPCKGISCFSQYPSMQNCTG